MTLSTAAKQAHLRAAQKTAQLAQNRKSAASLESIRKNPSTGTIAQLTELIRLSIQMSQKVRVSKFNPTLILTSAGRNTARLRAALAPKVIARDAKIVRDKAIIKAKEDAERKESERKLAEIKAAQEAERRAQELSIRVKEILEVNLEKERLKIVEIQKEAILLQARPIQVKQDALASVESQPELGKLLLVAGALVLL